MPIGLKYERIKMAVKEKSIRIIKLNSVLLFLNITDGEYSAMKIIQYFNVFKFGAH